MVIYFKSYCKFPLTSSLVSLTDSFSTMGIFPIIMNILQFWLIDSIVKASSVIALDGNSLSHFDSEYREPLFNSDDEDDDAYNPGDLENQRIRRLPLPSDGQQDKSSDVNEHKSTSTSAIYDNHSYPPSLSSSITCVAPSGNDHVKAIRPAKNLMKKQRREPPPPLSIEPVGQPVINSSQVTTPPSGAKTPEQQSVEVLSPTIVRQRSAQGETTEWADSWEDAEEWAAHVGEDKQTGRRLEDR